MTLSKAEEMRGLWQKTRKKINQKPTLVIVFMAVALIAALAAFDDDKSTAPTEQPRPDITGEMQKALSANIPLQYYEIEKIKEDNGGYSISVLYDKHPDSIGIVDVQMRSLVYDAVHFLMKKGRNPFTEQRTLFAFASIEVEGVTGQKMYHPYGMAHYDFNSDGISFEPDSH